MYEIELTAEELLLNNDEVEKYDFKQNGELYVVVGGDSLVSKQWCAKMENAGYTIDGVDMATNRVFFNGK